MGGNSWRVFTEDRGSIYLSRCADRSYSHQKNLCQEYRNSPESLDTTVMFLLFMDNFRAWFHSLLRLESRVWDSQSPALWGSLSFSCGYKNTITSLFLHETSVPPKSKPQLTERLLWAGYLISLSLRFLRLKREDVRI